MLNFYQGKKKLKINKLWISLNFSNLILVDIFEENKKIIDAKNFEKKEDQSLSKN